MAAPCHIGHEANGLAAAPTTLTCDEPDMNSTPADPAMTTTFVEHRSPALFLQAWVAEHGIQRAAFIGNRPPLPVPEGAGSESDGEACDLLDCNGQPALDALVQHGRLDGLIVADYLESTPATTAVETLAAWRNALLEAIIVFINPARCPAWQARDFYALGFHQVAGFPHREHPLIAYEYAIRTYNHERLWNNSRFWANPQNFGRYWW